MLVARLLLAIPLLHAHAAGRVAAPPARAPASTSTEQAAKGPAVVLPDPPPPPPPLPAPGVTWQLADVLDATLRAQPGVAAAAAGVELQRAGQLGTVALLDGVIDVDATADQLLAPDSHERVDSATASVSFSQLFASGTTLAMSLESSRRGVLGGVDGGGASDALSTSALGATLRQSLFRRALDGDVVQSAHELVEATQCERRHAVNALVLSSTLAYWRLAGSWHALTILRDAEERARRIERDTAALVAADEVPAAELVQLRANVVDKARLRRDAEHDVVAARAALRAATGEALSGQGDAAATGIVGAEFPPLPVASLDAAQVAARATTRRWDAAAARVRMDARRLAAGFAERNLAPRVDVAGTARVLVGAAGTSVDDWATHPLNPRPGYEVGVSLGVALPIANSEARASSVAAAAALSIAEADARAIEIAIRQQAVTAVDELHTAAETLRLARDTVALSRAAVDNERLKRKAGVSTLIDVVLIEDRLTAALLAELFAQVRYASVLAQAHFAAGSLDAENKDATVLAASLLTTEGL